MNEPLYVDADGFVCDNNDRTLAMTTEEESRRIVACVNALAGVPTEELEPYGPSDDWSPIKALVEAARPLTKFDCNPALKAALAPFADMT